MLPRIRKLVCPDFNLQREVHQCYQRYIWEEKSDTNSITQCCISSSSCGGSLRSRNSPWKHEEALNNWCYNLSRKDNLGSLEIEQEKNAFPNDLVSDSNELLRKLQATNRWATRISHKEVAIKELFEKTRVCWSGEAILSTENLTKLMKMPVSAR